MPEPSGFHEVQSALAAPIKYIYPSTLKACGDLGNSQQGRIIHDCILREKLETDVVISSALIDMYCKCRCLQEAHSLFNRQQNKNIVTWGALIAGYAQHGYYFSAASLFTSMVAEGIKANRVTILSVLKACTSAGSLVTGRVWHDQCIRYGFESDLAIGNTVVAIYSKYGSLEEAEKIFDDLKGKNVVSWCAMIAGHMQCGQYSLALGLFERMFSEGLKPNSFVFSSALKACGSINAMKQGRIVHDQIIRNMLESDIVIGSSLTDIYAETGHLYEAQYLFDKLKRRNIVSWNVMISGYVHHMQFRQALSLFAKMNLENVKPNKATYLYLLKVCGDTGCIENGNILYCHILESCIQMDEVIGSSLIEMYVMCGGLEEACVAFQRLPKQNVITWSAIIQAHTSHGHDLQALELFEKMQEDGIEPDKVTFLCLLKAIAILEMEDQGALVHSRILVAGLECDVMVANSLVHMYCSCGMIDSACYIFDKMSLRDTASWGAVIMAHSARGNATDAFGYFKLMHQEGMKPDRVTLLCMLKSCAAIGALEQGKLLHDYVCQNEADTEVSIGNALIDMYARIGSIEDSYKVFSTLTRPDIISWGAMISGYAEYGYFELAWECMQRMEKQGLCPNSIVFTSILSACGRLGNLDAGHRYFSLMVKHYGIKPTFEHVNCVADLFGHSGCLEEAMHLLQSVPGQPDLTGWISLLTACRTHCNRSLGQRSFNGISQQDSSFAIGYNLLADVNADVHDCIASYRLHEARVRTKAWKILGKAELEMVGDTHEFIVGDKVHPSHDSICSKLENLREEMLAEGYFPRVGSIESKGDGSPHYNQTLSEVQVNRAKSNINLMCTTKFSASSSICRSAHKEKTKEVCNSNRDSQNQYTSPYYNTTWDSNMENFFLSRCIIRDSRLAISSQALPIRKKLGPCHQKLIQLSSSVLFVALFHSSLLLRVLLICREQLRKFIIGLLVIKISMFYVSLPSPPLFFRKPLFSLAFLSLLPRIQKMIALDVLASLCQGRIYTYNLLAEFHFSFYMILETSKDTPVSMLILFH
ncbi:hypothetical protein KP509_34G048600 [Ceratopteris richardii]|uniref:Pentatricopeptide repeat-containing protein n=1 Tax=Ceratopteris richardii TaxID=49495 RepID=A0A8T2QKJ0_CERRI|nr:hypothetical protein KP509_34G048600 [Ceratopteris richardii]